MRDFYVNPYPYDISVPPTERMPDPTFRPAPSDLAAPPSERIDDPAYYAPQDRFANFDWLVNRYPRYKDEIQLLRAKGFQDEHIAQFYADNLEPRLNLIGNKEQVDKHLGRTPESIDLDRQFQEYKQFEGLKKTYPDKKDDELIDAIYVAQHSGYSVSNLLKYPELFKKITDGKLLHYQWLGSQSVFDDVPDYRTHGKLAALAGAAKALGSFFLPDTNPIVIGGKNFFTTRDIASVGIALGNGKITREQAQKQKAQLMKQMLPEAIVDRGYNKWIKEAAQISAQGYSTALRAATWGKGTQIAGAGLAAAAGVAGVPLATLYSVGALYGSFRELWDLSSGLSMLQYAEMTDDEGKPIDLNAAKMAADLDAAVTVVLEMSLLPQIAELVPGAKKLFGFGQAQQGISQSLASVLKSGIHKTQPFAEVINNYIKGVASGTLNNDIETLSTHFFSRVAQFFSGQNFSTWNKNNPIHWIKDFQDTTEKSIQGFGIIGLTGLMKGLYFANQYVQNYQNWLNNTAKENGMTPQELEQTAIQILEEIEAFSKQITSEVQTQNQQTQQQDAPTQENQQPDFQQADTQVQETTAQQENTPEKETQEQQSTTSPTEEAKYIFVPTKNLQAFLADNNGLEIQGAFQAGEETGIPAEQFEKLKAEHPEFTNTILNDIRYGTEAVTVAEAKQNADGVDIAETQAYYSEPIQNLVQQQKQNYIDAGVDEDEAEIVSELYGHIAANIRAYEGEIINPIEVKTSEQIQAQEQAEAEAQNDMSRVNDENYEPINPSTWTDQQRAANLLNAAQEIKLDNISLALKSFVDTLHWWEGINEADAEDTNSTVKKLFGQELKDYQRTLKNASQDAIDFLTAKFAEVNELFEINPKFPKGKSKHPDQSYEVNNNYIGKTKIDIAENNGNLYIKAKRDGVRQPFTLAIKNFRDISFTRIIDELTDGLTAVGTNGAQISRTPIVQNILAAIGDFWQKQNLIIEDAPAASIEEAMPVLSPEEIADDTASEAVLQDIPEQQAAPQIQQEQPQQIILPEKARVNLTQDIAQWNSTVDTIFADETITPNSKMLVPVLKYTPQVFTLVGADNLPVYMHNGKLKKILIDHPDMTPELLKQVVAGLNDPVAIFESRKQQKNPQLVVLLDVKDKQGASVKAAMHIGFDTKGKKQNGVVGKFNKLASAYGQTNEKTGAVNNTWFRNEVMNDMLLYVNKVKAEQWYQDTGERLLDEGENVPEGVKTQQDLQTALDAHQQEGFYKTDASGEKVFRTSLLPYGRAMIELLQKGNLSAHIHEVGHALFGIVDGLAEKGHLQMQQDRDYILGRAGVTLDEWLAEKPNQRGGVREKAHEWFANAFEAYLYEGQAPTPALQKVFDRARTHLIKIYDIAQSLGVTLNDQDRELFHRLLGMPGTESDKVSDLVIQNMRLEKEIANQQQQLEQLERQQASELQEYQDFLREQELAQNEQKGTLEFYDEDGKIQDAVDYLQALDVNTYGLKPDALVQVADYLRSVDDVNAQREALEAEQEYFRNTYAAIKEAGGINGADVEYWLGSSKVKDFARRHRQIYHAAPDSVTITNYAGKKGKKRVGTTYDKVIEQLADMGHFVEGGTSASEGSGEYRTGDVNALWNFLEKYDPSILRKHVDDAAPSVPVNTDTVNALLAAIGAEDTISYLKARKKHIQNSQEAEIVDEGKRIDEWLKVLDPDMDEGIEPHKGKKQKRQAISQLDLRQAAKTGFILGEQKERLLQQEKLQTQQDKAEQILKQSLAAEKEKGKTRLKDEKIKAAQRLETIQQRIKERAQSKIDKITARYKKQISKRQEVIANLRESRKSLAEKHNIRRTVKRIIGMSKSKGISWAAHQELRQLVDSFRYDRDERDIVTREANRQRRELLRTFLEGFDENEGEQYTNIEEFAEEYNITPEEIDEFSSHTYLDDMTLAELRELYKAAQNIYRQGRQEYEIWKNEQTGNILDMQAHLEKSLVSHTKAPSPRTIQSRQDLIHKYTLGTVGELFANFRDSTLSAGRFLEMVLGKDFRRFIDDGFTSRRGEAYSHIWQRVSSIDEQLRSIGLSFKDFAKEAIEIDGESFSWSKVMMIYAGMQNQFSHDAILYGNFTNNAADRNKVYATADDAMTAINKMLELINQPENAKYKQAAEIFMQDFSDNFDRIQDAHIRNFNSGMNREDHYLPMFRYRTQGSGGFSPLMNDDTDALIVHSSPSKFLQDTNDGYAQSRIKISPEKQEPIELDIVKSWYQGIVEQEFDAALGGIARTIRGALTLKGGENGSIQEMIAQRVGPQAVQVLRNIYNNSISDKGTMEMDAASALGKLASHLTRARSFAYVAFNAASRLQQLTSLPFALGYSNRGHMFRSLAKFMGMVSIGRVQEFMDSVYQLYPELRYSSGDPDIELYHRYNKYNGSGVMATISGAAYKGMAEFDRAAKAVVFDMAYHSRLDEGYSQEEAVRLAIRAVQDTQPATSRAEMSNLDRSYGWTKLLFTQFMGTLAPIYNMGVVDVIYNFTHPSWNGIKKTVWGLLGLSIGLALSGAIRSAVNGDWPTGEEREDGTTDNWSRWFVNNDIEGILNSVPLFNSFLVPWYRHSRGNKVYRSPNRFTEPLENLQKGFGSILDYDEDKGVDWDSLAKGAAQVGIPIPYSGAKQWARWLGLLDDTD